LICPSLRLCIEKEVQCGNKIVWRADKSEKVGVSVEVDGRYCLILILILIF
jgi:UDP-N-acetylglucosamine pyrophosphorylase